MTNEQIEKFLSQKNTTKAPVQINFKSRKPIKGLFIKTADYADLKSKNLWRIVGESNLDDYKKSEDNNLARIFNGVEITKLEVV